MSQTGLRPNLKTLRSKPPWIGVTSIKRKLKSRLGAKKNTPEGRSVLWNADKFTLSRGLLYYRYKPKYQIKEVKHFVVPRAHRRIAIDGCHCDAGHQGNVMIWKEFPGYQIFIFCKYNNYFVSLHGFSLDVTNSKSHWF